MMPGLMSGLEIGKRALLTNQYTLQTIGHNIANVNTPGYSRQRVSVTSTIPEGTAFGPVGTGVTAKDIRQVRDLFLGEQYREAAESYGQWSYKEKTLGQVEALFNEPNDNALNDLLNQFWDSWSDLSTNADSANNRNLILASANQLVNGINQIAQKLDDLRGSIDADMRAMTLSINQYTSEIANLNQQIQRSELDGQRANDLRDARDLLTQQLSSLIDVQTVEKDNGATQVYMGGMVIVDGADSFPIGTETENDRGQPVSSLVWEGTSVVLKNRNGELYGLMDSRDSLIPQYQAELNELTRAIVEEVNAIHLSGFDPDGDAGVPFFDPNYTDALTIRINPAVQDNSSLIVASETPDGGNQIALDIAGLRTGKVMNDGSQSINDYYNSLIGKLGVETHEAASFTSNYELLMQQIDTNRQAVEGVSLDEEMANMVKFQHAYDAAARVITAMDQALDTVIGSMGIVGR